MPIIDYIAGERRRAIEWKHSTPDLPDEARAPGDYVGSQRVIVGPFDYCLPPAFARFNLLDDARERAIGLFAELRIRWHDTVEGGPGNHLLASQIQCVNALAPLIDRPDAVRQLFESVLPIEEVLPIDFGGALTFEWIGVTDYLREQRNAQRLRGALATSADAAIRYRSTDRTVEVALIEWKFVEDYTAREPAKKDFERREARMKQRRWLWEDDACPLHRGSISYQDLFEEFRYQLFRLTALADRMERAHELDAERVRLIVAAPARNHALRDDLQRWPEHLINPDRFSVFDTDRLLHDSAPTTSRYRARYSHSATT